MIPRYEVQEIHDTWKTDVNNITKNRRNSLALKIGDLVFIESCGSIWRFNNTSLIYLGYVRGDIPSIADGRSMYFFYGEKNRRISIREKVLERMKIKK